jgi:hypothetical protein
VRKRDQVVKVILEIALSSSQPVRSFQVSPIEGLWQETSVLNIFQHANTPQLTNGRRIIMRRSRLLA